MEPLEDSYEWSIVFGMPSGTWERLWTMEGYWKVQEAERTIAK